MREESTPVYSLDSLHQGVFRNVISVATEDQEIQMSPEIVNACIRGWVARIGEDDLTLAELEKIPPFMMQHPEFQEKIDSSYPGGLQRLVRRRPRTYDERINQIDAIHRTTG